MRCEVIYNFKVEKEKRLKNLISIARRIAEFRYDNDHREIEEVVTEAARKRRCEPGAIELQGIEYSEDFEW